MELAIDFLNATTIGVASLIFLLCLFLYGRPLKNVNGSSKEPPTVAGAWPIFGHLPLLIGSKSPHKALGALAEKYGPLFTIKLGAKKALVVNDWEMARECFTTNDVAVSARPKLLVAELMCYNNAMLLVAPYGPYWRELRKIIVMEILSPSRVEQLQDVRVSEVQNSIAELYDVWRSQKNESDYASVELKQWFAQPIFNMVLRMVVGKRFLSATATDEKAEKCVKAVDEFMRLAGVFTVGDAIPYLRWFDFGGYEKAMKETAKELDVMISEWLEEHRQKRALGEGLDGAQDFMNVMLSSLDGKTIDGVDADTLIKSTVLLGVLSSFNQSIARLVPGLTIIQAGTEASITTIIWAMCLILKNPLILEKIKEELDIQVGKDRCLCESDISNLVYLQAVVKETFRLYAPGPLSSPREFAEDCTLGGYHVKKGTRLITNIWKIHTDPNVWPDPFDFKPDRFLTTHKDIDVKGHHFQLLPFGSGRRVCPGISFGLQTVHLTLASFLHSFEILNPSTEHLDMTEAFGVTNTKATPLEVLIKPRLSPSCYKSM